MYRFCTAALPIRAIFAISENVIGAMEESPQLLIFPVLVTKCWWIRARGRIERDCSSPT